MEENLMINRVRLLQKKENLQKVASELEKMYQQTLGQLALVNELLDLKSEEGEKVG